MTVLHVAHLFDYREFQTQSAVLIQAANSGDGDPVLARSIAIFERLQRTDEEWILHDPWSNPLLPIDTWTKPLTPEQLGYCFLVVLSEFLRLAPISLLGDWPILHSALVILGWGERDAILLTSGMSMEALLRSGQVQDPLWRPVPGVSTANNDFAQSVRAGYGNTGWLDTQAVSDLLGRLLPLRASIAQIPPERLQRDASPTVGTNVSIQRVLAVYSRAIAMLKAAKREHAGLFMRIS